MRQFQCVPTTYVQAIPMCTYNICLFNKWFFHHKIFLNKFSTTFIYSKKWACRNEQLFMQFVMHLDDRNRLSILCFWQLILRSSMGVYCQIATCMVVRIYHECENGIEKMSRGSPFGFVLFVLMLYIPVSNFSVTLGWFPVFLGWTSTKQQLKCLA